MRWVVYALGARWFGRAAGALGALLLITRVPVLSYGVRAYVDIPYLLLVLSALLVESRRPAGRLAGAGAARARRAAAPRGVGVLGAVLAVPDRLARLRAIAAHERTPAWLARGSHMSRTPAPARVLDARTLARQLSA